MVKIRLLKFKYSFLMFILIVWTKSKLYNQFLRFHLIGEKTHFLLVLLFQIQNESYNYLLATRKVENWIFFKGLQSLFLQT